MPWGKPYGLLTVILLALAIALGFAAALNWQERSVAASARHTKALREQIRQNGQFAAAFRQLFREAAEAVRPSVAGIKAYRSRPERPGNPAERPPDEPEEFRRPFPFLPSESAGSGVIVETDRGIAYILTNEHVVHGADRIIVNLSDGREFEGRRRAEDRKTDLALITVEGHDLAAAEIGNSDELVVGDWILAIGNPFGLSHTVTTGIVSAKGRSDVRVIASRQAYEDFIQTDAAINPGNSGGPLVNLDGQVVGITTAIVSRSGGSQGVGFAIPINLANKVYRQLRDKGRVSRGWLGVQIQQMSKAEAALLGMEAGGGVRVVGTFAGNPAAKAGLQQGDIIVKFGDRDVRTVEELRKTVADAAISSEVAVVVVRDGKPVPLTVTLVEQPEEVRDMATVEGEKSLGLVVQELTPELAKEFGYTGQQGVLVTDVSPGSRAATAGVPPGALIQWIRQGKEHQYQVRSVKDFENGLKSVSLGKPIGLTLRLPGTSESVLATIE